MKNTKITSNLLYSIVNTIIFGLVNLAYPLIIGFIYHPTLVGNFSFFNSWVIILSIPIVNGIAPSLSRFIAANSNNKEKIMENMGILFSIIYILTIIIIFPITNIFTTNFSWQELLLVLGLLLSSIFHYLFRHSDQGKEKFKSILILEAISFILIIPLVIVFFFHNGTREFIIQGRYYLLALPMLIYHFTFSLIFILIKNKRKGFNQFFKLSKNKGKRMLFYAVYVFISNVFVLGLSQVQIIISKNMLTDTEVGILGFWNSATAPLALLTVSIISLLIPRLTNLQLNKEHMTEYFVNKFNWGLSLIVIPFFGTLFLFISAYPNWIDAIVPAEYQTMYYWPIIILLAIKEVNNLLWSPTMSYLSTSEMYIPFVAILSFLYAICVVIPWIFLVPKLGIFGLVTGIAIGSFLTNFLFQLIGFVVYKRKIGSHIIYIIITTAIWYLFFYFMKWSKIGITIIWLVINIPFFVYGIITLIKLFKISKYSFRYGSEIDNLRELDYNTPETNNQ